MNAFMAMKTTASDKDESWLQVDFCIFTAPDNARNFFKFKKLTGQQLLRPPGYQAPVVKASRCGNERQERFGWEIG